MFKAMVERDTGEGLELSNRMSLVVRGERLSEHQGSDAGGGDP